VGCTLVDDEVELELGVSLCESDARLVVVGGEELLALVHGMAPAMRVALVVMRNSYRPEADTEVSIEAPQMLQ